MISSVIISGAASGIGKATTELLLKNNINVLGLDLSDPSIDSTLYKHLKVDLSDHKCLEDANLKKTFSLYQGLVNAAGITLKYDQNDKYEIFEKTLKVNLIAPYYLIETFAESRLYPYKLSSIVNISSIGGIMGFPKNPSYCASKGGLESLTRALSIDLFEKKIRVNSIRPGYTETPMNQKSLENKSEKELRSKHTVMNRWGSAHEIAESILFLLSDKSSYITGSCLTVDGGWTIKGLNI